MNIELKLTSDQVFAVARLLEQVYETQPTDINQKVMRSIAIEVADKYTKKQHAIYSKQSLFDAKKKHKMTLKFHEAFALYSVIELLLFKVTDIYCNTILKTLLGNLNQKLS